MDVISPGGNARDCFFLFKMLATSPPKSKLSMPVAPV
eukprot:CAMPEP_0196153096 /NCGR_PEP_ID=MMETSP0910-20130528/36596_1 /TAXON_ID=49265 /ORGANISM="Thalassiosira rotula, Strain GSO102" /LENGTH=36 /DNA_ID= /DNA_START= /DNA_END= /DNA_ORIENTATION=